MVNRVLLNQSGLKVSAPGIDVLSASASQLQFSSDWSAMGVVQSGDYGVSWSGGLHFGSIGFTKTFASPPFCAFFLDRGSYLVPLGYGAGFTFMVNRFDGDATNAPSRSCLVGQVGTTGISVSAMYYLRSGGVPVPTYTIRYYVFDNNQ